MPEGAAPSPAQPAPSGFDLRQTLETARAVLTAPREFWPRVAHEEGLQRPLVFAVAMGLAAGVVSAVIGILHLDGIFGYSAGFASVLHVLVYPIAALIGMFVGGGILFVIGSVLGARPSYERAARIAAYGMAVYPLYPIAGLVPLLSLAPQLYGLYLVGLGMIALFPTDARKTWTAMLVLGAIALFATTSAYFAARSARQALERYGSDVSRAAEELRRTAEEARKRP
jgi:hypothetical protein